MPKKRNKSEEDESQVLMTVTDGGTSSTPLVIEKSKKKEHKKTTTASTVGNLPPSNSGNEEAIPDKTAPTHVVKENGINLDSINTSNTEQNTVRNHVNPIFDPCPPPAGTISSEDAILEKEKEIEKGKEKNKGKKVVFSDAAGGSGKKSRDKE